MDKKALQSNLAKLPVWCYGYEEVHRKIIRIKRGELGYYPAENAGLDPNNKEEMEAIIDQLNDNMNVTKAQREAMEMGSLFGWDIPAANPDMYNEDLSFKAVKLRYPYS